MPDIQYLPPQGNRARTLALAFLVLAPFLFGFLALALGQDANWDLRNYHWYNAYAFLNGRYGFDLLPSQTPWFYNPVLDVPFYLLATHVPAKLAGYMLGFVQGINFILLFMLAYASLVIANARWKVIACAALAALGMLGGGGIALIGTTFYDNVTSLGLFASALLVIRYSNRLIKEKWPGAFRLALLCGIPAGLMMGLKLPSVIFCLGLCCALLLTGNSIRRQFIISFAFGLGVLLGLLLTYGYWMWFLQSHYGNPLFPYFNQIFHSPLAPQGSARDTQFIPQHWQNFLLFPFLFAKSSYMVGEIPWRDWRIPILYALLPLALIFSLLYNRRRKRSETISEPFATRYLLWVAVISYGAWLSLFCIYRYAVPLEMLAPLLIVLAVGMLPLKKRTRTVLAGLILLVAAASIEPGNWFRRDAWLDRFVEADVPPLPDHKGLMILMAGYEPYSHLIPEFPPDIPFVRIASNFVTPDDDSGFNQVLRARVEEHKGPFMLLIPVWQKSMGAEALDAYGLALAPAPCQTVIDRLYDDKEMALCKVVRLPTKRG